MRSDSEQMETTTKNGKEKVEDLPLKNRNNRNRRLDSIPELMTEGRTDRSRRRNDLYIVTSKGGREAVLSSKASFLWKDAGTGSEVFD